MRSSSSWLGQALDKPVAAGEPPAGTEVYARIRNLHKRFGPRHILRGIDLDVYHGETLVILGGSGSGKTTLLKHLMGSHTLDEGQIFVGDFDLAKMRTADWTRYRGKLGVVFQMAALLGSLSVEENVGLPLIEVERQQRRAIRHRVIEALHSVYLPAEEILHLRPDELSGGMRKRVGIARAIIRKPELMLYDEPTTGLDPVTVSGVNELTLRLQQQLGVTSVVITHDLEAAFTIANRIALLYKGRIVALGDPDQIRASDHPVAKQMLTGSTYGPLTRDFVAPEDDVDAV